MFSTWVTTEGLIQFAHSERKVNSELYAQLFSQVLC